MFSWQKSFGDDSEAHRRKVKPRLFARGESGNFARKFSGHLGSKHRLEKRSFPYHSQLVPNPNIFGVPVRIDSTNCVLRPAVEANKHCAKFKKFRILLGLGSSAKLGPALNDFVWQKT